MTDNEGKHRRKGNVSNNILTHTNALYSIHCCPWGLVVIVQQAYEYWPWQRLMRLIWAGEYRYWTAKDCRLARRFMLSTSSSRQLSLFAVRTACGSGSSPSAEGCTSWKWLWDSVLCCSSQHPLMELKSLLTGVVYINLVAVHSHTFVLAMFTIADGFQ